MCDWNVVVSVHEHGYTRARHLLEQLGAVTDTEFFNVLVMRIEDPNAFLEQVANLASKIPELLDVVSRVVPCSETFCFENLEDFETKARACVLKRVAELAGKSFHVRLHRRGLKGVISSPAEERFLDDALLKALEEVGTPGRINFDDPDAVIDIETVGNRAGIALWHRADLVRYPFLKPD